jgi:MoaA/NifB/PqqE/SkfB family radical SAM enzyme
VTITFTLRGRDAAWMDDAACRPGTGTDPNWFVLPYRRPGARPAEDRRWRDEAIRRVLLAKATCASCPVIDACEGWARAVPITDGIWGGLTPAERGRPTRKATRKRGGL